MSNLEPGKGTHRFNLNDGPRVHCNESVEGLIDSMEPLQLECGKRVGAQCKRKTLQAGQADQRAMSCRCAVRSPDSPDSPP